MFDRAEERRQAAERAERADRIKSFFAQEGFEAVLVDMREVAVAALMDADPKDDEQRYRLAVAIRLITNFSGIIDRIYRDGASAKEALERWVNEEEKKLARKRTR